MSSQSPNGDFNQDAFNDYKVELGKALKQLRQKKGLTQMQLSKDCTLQAICSEKTLRRIENGETEPSPDVLRKLLAVLGVSLEQFAYKIFGSKMRAFSNEIDAIWDILFANNFHEARKRLEKLRISDFCDKHNPIVNQSLLLCDGIIEKNINHDYQKCIEILHGALSITAPQICLDDAGINCESLGKCAFTLIEYRVMNVIANTKIELKQISEGRNIFEAIHASLLNHEIDAELRKKLLPNNCFNLSNLSHDEGLHQESLNYSKKGVEFCEETKTLKIYGKLLYNMGRAFICLEDVSQATVYFKRSCSFFEMHNDNNNAIHVRTTVKKKYGICI